MRGRVKVAISLPADRHQPVLEALRHFPGASVAEERTVRIGRGRGQGLSTSAWLAESRQEIPTPQYTLVITILPR